MDDVSTRMRAAVAEPPPTLIDLDRLIAGERRRSRTITWTTAGTGVAAAVAAIVVAPGLLTGSGPGGAALPMGAPSSGSSAAGPAPTLCAPLSPSPTGPQPPLQSHDTVRARPTEAVARAVPRLTASLREALRETLPASARVESPQDGCVDPQFQFHPSYREYEVAARVTEGKESGFLIVRIMPTPAMPTPRPGDGCHVSDDPRDCERIGFPDGTVATASTMDVGSDGLRQISVLVRRPDGTAVFLLANNYLLGTGRDDREPTLTGAEPPLTTKQMIAVGRDPGLTLYP